MKRIILLIIANSVSITTLFAANAVEINGLYYYLKGDSATITSHFKTITTSMGSTASQNYTYQSISIPATVSYENKTYVVSKVDKKAFAYCRALTSVSLPKSIISIGDQAFNYCENLKEIKIPQKTQSIGMEMCFGCTSLKEIDIPNNVTFIGEQAFLGCSNVSVVTIGEQVKTIETNAFAYMPKLTQIHWNAINGDCYQMGNQVTHFYFGDKVKIIPNNLCYGMNKVDSIIIPNGVQKICGSAFGQCNKLSYVQIGDSVQEIEGSSFENCTSLKQISIGVGITRIADWAFNNCKNIRILIMRSANPPTIYENTFSDVPIDALILVPCGAETAYRTAPFWQEFTNIQSEMPFTVDLLSSNLEKGTVEVVKPFDCGDNKMIIQAQPQSDCQFSEWDDGNMDNPRIITIFSDTSFVASFESAVPTNISKETNQLNDKNRKNVRDGVLIIERNGVYYNAQGAIVE